MGTMPFPSLDNRHFAMISSTASAVDEARPTVFRYHETSGLVWGDYAGDTVRLGHFVGSRAGDQVRISFGHVVATTGSIVTGVRVRSVMVGT